MASSARIGRNGGSKADNRGVGQSTKKNRFDLTFANTYAEIVMEVHFSPQTEQQLKQFAASKGKDAAEVVEEAVVRMLEARVRFIEGVKRGIEAADRGDLIEHGEVVSRIERLFRR
jgi:predicted transcriptional regulator